MIYSPDNEKICGLCVYAESADGDGSFFCRRRKKNVNPADEACKRYSYDIFKRTVHRRRRLKTSFSEDTFKL